MAISSNVENNTTHTHTLARTHARTHSQKKPQNNNIQSAVSAGKYVILTLALLF